MPKKMHNAENIGKITKEIWRVPFEEMFTPEEIDSRIRLSTFRRKYATVVLIAAFCFLVYGAWDFSRFYIESERELGKTLKEIVLIDTKDYSQEPGLEKVVLIDRYLQSPGYLDSPIAETGYTVNLATFKKEERAKQLSVALKKNGYDAFVWKEGLPPKGAIYLVSVGKFPTRKQAELFGNEIAKTNKFKLILEK